MEDGVLKCDPGTKGRSGTAIDAAMMGNKNSIIYISAGTPTQNPDWPPFREGTSAYIAERLVHMGYRLMKKFKAEYYTKVSHNTCYTKDGHSIMVCLVGENETYGTFEEAMAFGAWRDPHMEIILVSSHFHIPRIKLCWFLLYGRFPKTLSWHDADFKNHHREFFSIIEAGIFGIVHLVGGKRLLKPISNLKNKLIAH
jgi:hypothetical protein